MPYLILNIGTRKPSDDDVVNLSNAIYRNDHPGDVYGNAIIIECEFMDDAQTAPTFRLRDDVELQTKPLG